MTPLRSFSFFTRSFLAFVADTESRSDSSARGLFMVAMPSNWLLSTALVSATLLRPCFFSACCVRYSSREILGS
jgi:hypothetical protein